MKNSSDESRSNLMTGCLGWGFSSVFFLAGAGTFWLMAIVPIWQIVDARGWQEAQCTVLNSEVESSEGSDSTTYRIAITYEYEVGRTQFQGDRYNFSSGYSSGYDRKAAIVAEHPRGSETTCWVDPADATKSVINRDPGLYLLWGLFPIPFLLVGIGGFLIMIYGQSWSGRPQARARRLARPSVAPAVSPTPSTVESSSTAASYNAEVNRLAAILDKSDNPPPPEIHHGPMDLESESHRLISVIALGIFAGVWNSILLFFILPSTREDLDIFSTLFAIPFILVGIGVIGFTVHQALALLNPKIHLTVSDGDLRLGESYSLAWKLTGSSDRLRQLVIYLEGRESATYRRGTDTTTEHSVFLKQTLVDEQRLHFKDGRVTLQLPEDSVPSFKARRNEIQWRLVVEGDIPWWPDLRDTFTVWVRAPRHFEGDRV